MLAATGWLPLHAQLPAQAPRPAPGAPLERATLADYTHQVKELRAMAAACAQKADACATAAVADQRVTLSPGQSFDARYEWFSAAMASAKTRSDSARAAEMMAVKQRLDAELADATTPLEPPVKFSAARRQADVILADREFQSVDQSSLWDRFLTWLGDWIGRALVSVAAFGKRSPWIGPLIEWSLAGLAGALLLAWVLRTMRRQRLSLRLETAGRMEAAEERVLNWLREAEQQAERGAFRDAVHCLYWASITLLEGRRLWHPDRARTPREYLRLLDTASAAAGLLRRQTASFESIWYGLRPAEQWDYDQALTLHRQLRSA